MAPPPYRTTVPHKQVRRNDDVQKNEEQFLKGRYFHAACPATVTLKHLVRITGPAILGVRQVDIVDPTDQNKMPAVGIVVEKPTTTTCTVLVFGEANGGLFSGLTPNGRYFVGLDAKVAFPPPDPTGPGAYCMIQLIGVALGTTILQVNLNATMVKRWG